MTPEYLRTLVPSLLGQYRDTYGLRDLPVAIDYLRPMMEERGWVDRILWEEFDFPSQHIYAQVEFFRASMGVYQGDGDHARVRFSSGLNFCWKRFSICKEMFHAVIDNSPEKRITSSDELLKLAEMIVSETSASLETFSPYLTENAAVVLALETLFPFEIRSLYEERYRTGDISDHQLALRFRIPEQYARMGMYPSYFNTIRVIRQGTLINF